MDWFPLLKVAIVENGDVRENQETVEKEGVNNSNPDGVITISRGCNREDVGRNQEVQRRRYNVSLPRIDLPTLFSLVLLNLYLFFYFSPFSLVSLFCQEGPQQRCQGKEKKKLLLNSSQGLFYLFFYFKTN